MEDEDGEGEEEEESGPYTEIIKNVCSISLLAFGKFLICLISLSEFNIPLIGSIHSHDLSGKGIIFGSHTYFSDHTRAWRASSNEGTAECWGHLRDKRTGKPIHTIHAPIHSKNMNMKG